MTYLISQDVKEYSIDGDVVKCIQDLCSISLWRSLSTNKVYVLDELKTVVYSISSETELQAKLYVETRR